MGYQRKTITLSDRQLEFVKSRIEEGGYASDSEYFRDLVRRDQERDEAEADHRFRELQRAIEAGLASGTSPRNGLDIMADIMAGKQKR